MNCEQYQENISQLIDGELECASELHLFQHLGSCKQCQTFLKNILSLRNTLTGSQQMTVPVSVDQRVLKQPIFQNALWYKRKTQYSIRAIGLAVIFSALAGIFISSLWYTSQQPQHTIVCLTPLPEVEVNGYVVVASSNTKGINQ